MAQPIIIQVDTSLSVSEVTLSYAQCQPGSYELVCSLLAGLLAGLPAGLLVGLLVGLLGSTLFSCVFFGKDGLVCAFGRAMSVLHA